MRKIRILLLFAATAALAAVLGGVFAAKASALAFQDEPCPPDNATGLLHVCKPDGEVGKPYAMPVTGRAGCTPESVVYSLPNGSLPPVALSLGQIVVPASILTIFHVTVLLGVAAASPGQRGMLLVAKMAWNFPL